MAAPLAVAVGGSAYPLLVLQASAQGSGHRGQRGSQPAQGQVLPKPYRVLEGVSPVTLQARGTGRSSLFEHQFITIKAEPWVSEDTIRRTYREAQVRMLQGDNRPTKAKQIRLFRFVSARTNPYGVYREERAKLAKMLVSEWDRENPDDTYGFDTRRFWRDYDRSLLLVALPMVAAKQRERERESRERRRRTR